MDVKDIENLTIDDMKPLTISFKKNENELSLYKWILIHSGYSGFVKDKLREIKDADGNLSTGSILLKAAPEQVKDNNLIEFDF